MSFFSNIWITGASKPLTAIGADGGTPLCNIYIFSDTNPDELLLGSPFSGNLKVQIASDSETGVHPDIIAGRQKAFVASADVINDPQWVQYEIEAVAIDYIVDATFNGRVAYAKNDVWSYLDMGAPDISGTQLFLLDSLTAGPGNITPHPYYIEKQAFDTGRLRKMWVRPILASTQATKTGIGTSEGTITTGSSLYAPAGICLTASGTSQTDVLTLSHNEFTWEKCTVYFEQKSGGGTFDVTQPGTLSVDVAGVDGAIGSVEVTNPGNDLTSLKLSNFSTSINITGFLLTVNEAASEPLDVITFAVSGLSTAGYNNCLNIQDWYNELGITGAIINTGTNDNNGYQQGLIDYRVLMDNLSAVGVTAQDVLTVRPNDNAKDLGDMWEDIRDEYSTRFTSIVRIYGDLAEFNANDWMADGDNVHPNDTFNEILGNELYALNTVPLHDAVDLGVDANWITEFNNLMWIQYNSQVTITGDFTAQMRVRMDDRQFYLWDNDDGNINYLRINTDGSIRLELNNVVYDSPAGGVSLNSWHTLDIARSGATFTVNCDGAEVMNVLVATDDINFVRTGRSSAAYLIRGAVAWLEIHGQHKWLMNQTFNVTNIPDLTGAVDATWNGVLASTTNPTKLSVLPSGELLDYHYNVNTGIQWGSVNWPTGA